MRNFRGIYSRPQIITQSNDSILPSAVGAFLGAFFAFVFGMIAFYSQKKFERYWKHKNANVELEHLLNQHLDRSSDNQYLLDGAIDTLKKPAMTYTLLDTFRLPEDINLRIGDLEILNLYLDYEVDVNKINNGMATWQGMNHRLQETVISNPNIPPIALQKNMKHLQDQAETLIKFMKALDDNTKTFLAYIRVYMRKDKFIWSVWLFKLINKDKSFVSEKEKEEETEKLTQEIGEISRKSKERIAEIMK